MGITTLMCASLSADIIPFTAGNTTEIEKAGFQRKVSKMAKKLCCFQ